MSAINNLHVNINFSGGFYDKDTNLIRFGKRDYNPEQRRWSASDPIGFEGGDLNLYGYVLSDPIQFVDPEGLSSEDNQFIPPKMNLPYCIILACVETKADFCENFINRSMYEFKYDKYCRVGDRQACKFACVANDFYENLKKYCKLKMPKPKVKK